MRDFWALPQATAIQTAAIESIRRTGLKTDEDVRHLLAWMRDPRVGTKSNCGKPGHGSPMRFACDVLLGRTRDFIVWANRSGSKSYLTGLITWIRSSFIPNLETVIMGGSLEQSEKAYRAMTSFWNVTELQNQYLIDAPKQRTTEWKNLSRVHILTASTRSTRGPHPQSLFMDEIDEMEQDVYSSALSQPQSKFGIAASLGKLSTNHHAGGIMDQAIEKAKDTETQLYKWCVWECMESCRDYSCSTCKLSSYCPGEHMKEADGYYKVSDFVDKLHHLSHYTLQLEWLCDKIGRDDLVYGGEFDLLIHSPLDLPEFNAELPVLVSIDWGGTAPFSIGAWQRFPIGWVRIDEAYMGHTTNRLVLKECKDNRLWWRNVVGGIADASRPDLIQEWAEEGVGLQSHDGLVQSGIDAMRNALRPVIGRPLFFVNRRCRAWLDEVQSYYEKNGRPVKSDDHAMDETRYMVEWQMTSKQKKPGVVYHAGMKKKDEEKPKVVVQVTEQDAAMQALKERFQPRRGHVVR